MEKENGNQNEKIQKVDCKNYKRDGYSYLNLTGEFKDQGNYDALNKAMKYALRNKDINNIAVAGNYGSGKTTFLKNFFHHAVSNKAINHENILFVSLASFLNIKKNSGDVEKSILQQIIYSVDPSKIPQSKLLNNFTMSKTEKYAPVGLLFLLIFLFLTFPTILSIEQTLVKLSLLLIFSVGIAILLYQTILALHKYNVIKDLRFKDTMISFSEKEETNKKNRLFNMYMEELIYIFKSAEISTVVFEDIDRLDGNEIFISLREFNTILNNAYIIEENINFVYAIKEDLLEREEFTKFFEFIIHIQPITGLGNSDSVLRNLLIESGIFNDFYTNASESNKVEELSNYLNDTRMIKNIINEYNQIKNTASFNYNSVNRKKELLGLLVYKNLYQKDYAKMTKGESLLNYIFNRGQKLILNNIKSTLEDDIQEFTNGRQSFKSIKDLNNYIIEEIKKSFTITSLNKVMLNGEKIKDGERTRFYLNDKVKYNYTTKTIKQIVESDLDLDSLREKLEYYDELKDFERFSMQGLLTLNNKDINLEFETIIQDFNRHEKETSNKTHCKKDVISETTIDIYLIRYLIINGFINEDYVIHVYRNSDNRLSETDRNLKSKILSRDTLELTEEVTNPDEFIKSFSMDQVENNESLLLVNLLDYCLDNKEIKHSVAYIKLVSNKINASKLEFLDKYCQIKYESMEFKKITTLFHLVFKENRNFLNDLIVRNEKNGVASVFEYILAALDFRQCKQKPLTKESKRHLKNLKFIFKNNMAFNNFKDLSLENNFKLTELEGFEFEDIVNIFMNNLYEINYKNLSFIIGDLDLNIELEVFNNSNYTALKSSDNQLLIHYIDTHITEYIDNVYSYLEDDSQVEDPNYLYDLLHFSFENDLNDSIINDYRENVISKQKEVKDISKFPHDIVKMIDLNKITHNLSNLAVLFKLLGDKEGIKFVKEFSDFNFDEIESVNENELEILEDKLIMAHNDGHIDLSSYLPQDSENKFVSFLINNVEKNFEEDDKNLK